MAARYKLDALAVLTAVRAGDADGAVLVLDHCNLPAVAWVLASWASGFADLAAERDPNGDGDADAELRHLGLMLAAEIVA